MFKHIGDIDITDIDAERCRGNQVMTYGSLTYYDLKAPELLQPFVGRVPHSSLHWVEVAAGSIVPPHRDHGILCALNVYIETGNADTDFWQVLPGELPHCFPGQQTPSLFNWTQVRRVGGFKATQGSAYLLDVNQVHTVALPKGVGRRTFLQMVWDRYSYSEIVKFF